MACYSLFLLGTENADFRRAQVPAQHLNSGARENHYKLNHAPPITAWARDKWVTWALGTGTDTRQPLLILHDFNQQTFNQHICMGMESAFGKEVSPLCIRVLWVLSLWSRWCPKSFMDLKSLVWVPNTLTWQILRRSLIISLEWVCLSLFLARKHYLEHTYVVRGVNMAHYLIISALLRSFLGQDLLCQCPGKHAPRIHWRS